jgi:hypothetical protein
LPVIASVTSRWPLHSITSDDESPGEERINITIVSPAAPTQHGSETRYEEETDEMDALDEGDRTAPTNQYDK